MSVRITLLAVRERWLSRESTNRDGVVIAIGVSLLFAVLDVAGVLKTLPWWGWLAFAFVIGVPWAAFNEGRRRGLGDRDAALAYAQHQSDALDTLQKILTGAVESIRVRDFIQEGIFEPAHELLARGGRRDVRFSVLSPTGDGSEFEMTLAHGHSPQGRRDFRMGIDESFAGLAFRRGEIVYSDDTRTDRRFRAHPKARPEREYRSIVCIPLREGDSVVGVLVTVAGPPRAFSDTDRAYIQVLAGIIDVVREIPQQERGEDRSAA